MRRDKGKYFKGKRYYFYFGLKYSVRFLMIQFFFIKGSCDKIHINT